MWRSLLPRVSPWSARRAKRLLAGAGITAAVAARVAQAAVGVPLAAAAVAGAAQVAQAVAGAAQVVHPVVGVRPVLPAARAVTSIGVAITITAVVAPAAAGVLPAVRAALGAARVVPPAVLRVDRAAAVLITLPLKFRKRLRWSCRLSLQLRPLALR